MKMKKRFWGLMLRTKALVLSFRCYKGIHLMDAVIYQGKRYFVNNGVSAPMWDICEMEWNKDRKRESIRVHEDLLRKEITWRNIKNGLFSHYRWYMSYWYEIDLKKKLEVRG